MLEKAFDLKEISEDINKITKILNKHNKMLAQAEGEFELLRNGAILDDNNKEFSVYSHYQKEANNALFYMKTVLQPALQDYVNLYINNFSKKAVEDIEVLLDELEE